MNYYIKIAVRNLIREKKYSLFLLLSVCIGLITFILVSGYVFYEKGFDRVFPDNKNIYRITTDIYSENKLSLSIPECERGISTSINEKYPNVLAAGFITKTNNPQYKIGEEIFTNKHIYHASYGFLDVFSIPLVRGNKTQVLTRPYTAIISESTAKKYFGAIDPVGQVLFKYPVHEYTIEGVFRDIPKQAHFSADVLLSFHDDMHLPPPAKAQWGETGFYTYLKLKENTDLNHLEAGINNLVAENKKSTFEKNNIQHKYHLQPLNSIHLHSALKNELEPNSRAGYVYLIFMVGLLILAASGFNYIQFSFSRLINSAKQTGIKKINGATSSEIISASLAESLIIHLVALIVSLAVVRMLFPVMRNEFGILLEPVFAQPLFLEVLSGILAVSIFVNGVLPALLISRFNSLELLTLKYKPVANGISFRQVIVIAQFVIIIAIVSGISGMNKQVNFLIDKDKGLELTNTVVVKVPSNLRKTSQRINNLQAFEHDLTSHSSILGISSSNAIPGDLPAYNFNFNEKQSQKGGKAALVVADSSYITNYKIDLIAGNNFFTNSEGNNQCIINRACLAVLGFNNPDEIIGKVLKMRDESGLQNFDTQIVGVTENTDFSNAKEKHDPIILIDWTQNMIWGNYSIKTATANYASILPFIREKFHATFPNYPFEYVVLTDYYNSQFNAENQLIKIFKMFILVAVLISVINLFSISWLLISARVKEIGIRKVNGAKVSEVLTMLNKDFIKWVAIAFVIATPVAYYAMNKWLENFAYKTTLSWWIFALAGLLALGIALLTVSWQSWRAATRNPVEALRYE
ncbi:putative ABC transport system permease protein [Mariniphaga anaerophila]|uniref:Putative ABC transport system permease protein n=1 Tax=Mariniphaga anaerophila TaxID=1484053 RepID=A0A1M5FPA3_9BACT|nr:ABC transporter permease [Mariniphaga anaerophila]SHF93333.1 putative ABC transport system permease protein [Mariniphaga anaerophila]